VNELKLLPIDRSLEHIMKALDWQLREFHNVGKMRYRFYRLSFRPDGRHQADLTSIVVMKIWTTQPPSRGKLVYVVFGKDETEAIVRLSARVEAIEDLLDSKAAAVAMGIGYSPHLPMFCRKQ